MRVREQLRPELVGRLADILVFARLGYAIQRIICEAMIAAETPRLAALGYRIEVGPDAVEFLVRQGFHRTLGVRPMRSIVERQLQDAVSADVLNFQSGCGWVSWDSEADRLKLRASSETLPVPV